jgi:acetyltransferase-like isoleucine patch superfamily enzyme
MDKIIKMKIWRKIKAIMSNTQKANLNQHKVHQFHNVEIMHNTVLSGQNVIGEYTYVGFNCIITSSVIGRYCSIANNVSIGIGEHKINRVSTSSLFYAKPFETLTEGNCTIGNDVWLGSNVVVRRGVTIGDGAVVGANSFVNKDVMPFEIVGGTPAKSIKMRFSDDKIVKIQDSAWWEKDKETAKEIINKLEKTGLFETDLDQI